MVPSFSAMSLHAGQGQGTQGAFDDYNLAAEASEQLRLYGVQSILPRRDEQQELFGFPLTLILF